MIKTSLMLGQTHLAVGVWAQSVSVRMDFSMHAVMQVPKTVNSDRLW
jgi:hypothetical protein